MHKISDLQKNKAWDAGWREDPVEGPVKPLSREQAATFRQRHPVLSPWKVLAGQLAAGVVISLAAWLLTGKPNIAWSVLYGVLAVVIPGALFARGLMSRVSNINPAAAVAGFFVWEMVKVGLTVAMLFAAPRVVMNLSWPAMLMGLVVTMKVVWVVIFFTSRSKKLSVDQ